MVLFLMLLLIYEATPEHMENGLVKFFLQNNKQFYIPEGFAHGFLVLSDTAEFCYKCTDFYHPGDEGGLAWNDPEIGIEWPELVGEYSGCATAKGYHLKDGTSLTLSEKDQKWLGIAETFKFK